MYKKTTSSGAKAYQRTDKTDRSLAYRNWHRTLNKRLYAIDIDLVEIMFDKDGVKPVAITEITMVDSDAKVTESYLERILHRYKVRDFQAKASTRIAELLGVDAYIVLYRENCNEFWTYNLSYNGRWIKRNAILMEAFLFSLRKNE